MAVLKTILRRARTLLWTAFSIVIVLAAVVMGIGELLMPYSDRYQPRLEAWLSEEFGRPVRVDSFDGEWTAFGPRLTLRGMTLGPAAPADAPGQGAEVAIESAALDVKPLNLLMPGRPLYNFRVIGAQFDLTRTADGRLTLSGFGVTRRGGQTQGSALKELARVGEVILEDSRLDYRDDTHGIELAFGDIDGRLQLDGNELSSEVQASLYDRADGRVFGDFEATVRLSLDEAGRPRAAWWQTTARELMLAALQNRLPPNPFLPQSGWLNAELWGDWLQGEGLRLRGVGDLREARLVNDYQDLWLERLNTRFRWDGRGGKDWSLHFADLSYDDGQQSWTAPRVALARNTAAGLGLWISADRLPLGVPLRLARDIMSMYRTPWPRSLPGSADGEVRELDLVLDASWRLQLAHGDVSGARVADWERWPTLEGLDASVVLGRRSGRVDLRGDRVVIDWPRMFRDPLTVSLPPCRVTVDWGQGWQVGITGCSVGNEDLEAAGEAVIRSNTGRPAIDLNVAVRRGQVGRLDPYWPEAVLKEPVKQWLRRGLLGGDITAGRVQLRGDLDDFPFRGGEGRFEAVAQVSGGRLDFQQGWPEVRSLEATARFVDAGMDIHARSGEIGGVTAGEARAVIADFKSPVLELDYAAESDLPGMLGFLRRTPLREHVGAELDRFAFAGPAATVGHLEITFGAAAGEGVQLDGSVDLRGGRFADPTLGFTIDGISGRLDYDAEGVRADALQAAYEGKPARLALTIDTEAAELFRAELEGEFTVDEMAPAFLADGFGLLNRASGSSHWLVAVVADRAAEGKAVPVLRLETDLRGIALDLPPPLAKPAGAAWPFRLRFPLTGPERVLECAVGSRLAMAIDLPEGADVPRAAAFHLGDRRAALPEPGLLRIAGQTRRLDLDGWLDIVIDEAERGRGLGGLTLEPARVRANELMFLDRSFGEVAMHFSVEDTDIRAEFDGGDIDGKLRFTAGAGGMDSLSAEFERLALGEPLSSGMDVEKDPAELPALHLYAASLRYAGIELGETRIEAYPIANGFHFEKVEAASERLSLQAKGDWLLDAGGHRSDFNIRMASESLGDFLQSMDIASPVQGGQTLVYFNAWWPGSPAAFGLSRLNGEVEFSVVDGNIANASTGTGRLLGLLSVQALPKRLALDFRDVFDAGFSFDEASGSFAMENGTATTDNVLLRSSSANISVSGSTDLVSREYDQLMTIRPGVGNTLPIIGALAAGPPGAAAGLALQGLLHDSLAEATQVRYSITGSWEDPKIEAVEVERQDG
jgi:uncharacterized protein (TIGR02099 family)